MLTKVCKTCNLELPVPEFGAFKQSPDGMQCHCKKCTNAKNRRRYLNDSSRICAQKRSYYAKDADRIKSRVSQWRKDNVEVASAAVTRRRATVDNRKPLWFDAAAEKAVYENRPSGVQVDHVVPLRGKLVSGLHVHYNMQYLTPEENASKGNAFDPWTFDNDTWLEEYMRKIHAKN